MNIFPYRIVRLATAALLLPAAQTFGQGLPGKGASPTTIDCQDPEEWASRFPLGRQEVNRQIAGELAIAKAEVPLCDLSIDRIGQAGLLARSVRGPRQCEPKLHCDKLYPGDAEAAREITAVPAQCSTRGLQQRDLAGLPPLLQPFIDPAVQP
ncbi:hypothetical protein [Allomesorhizobium alhagi]|uniref:hypothetical protein n=1 Tax=Allomesorhizobium alhagi TaxID=475067 RepID=UPI001111D3C6|nr:hypothetical protein [Mesorhizobium alhagi]